MGTTMKQDEQDQERNIEGGERDKRGGKKMDRLCRTVE